MPTVTERVQGPLAWFALLGFLHVWPTVRPGSALAKLSFTVAGSDSVKVIRGSQTGRPEMALFDLLGRRWALRVIWELSQETLSFRALRERCDSMSTSVLNERLSEHTTHIDQPWHHRSRR
ncbi:MAG TPA: hypothetical protein VFY45_05210 [Baekduia sp.]|nr:hypothetical protein [Baekduia sp.]